MSQKNSKAIRRTVKREADKISSDAIKSLANQVKLMPFMGRLKFALKICFPKKRNMKDNKNVGEN